MKYLIPKFDCKLVGEREFDLYKNVQYKIQNVTSFYLTNQSGELFYINLNDNENVMHINYENNDYYFLFNLKTYVSFSISITFKNEAYILTLNNNVVLTLNGKVLCESNNSNLKFSHFEVNNDFCYLYFLGKRNFVIILKDKKVVFSDYYDECNILENERYYMCKLYDSLNHGKVCCIKGNEVETYLVYLDDFDLNLKDEFVSYIFLDCLLAGNYNYCNKLLATELKLEDATDIINFFEDFDDYYPIGNNTFILHKKNTLSGICKFEVCNKAISNIVGL